MAKALTAKAVEKQQPDPDRRLEIPDGLLPGLYLVVQPTGAKSWAVRFRANGRTAKVTLGRWPAIELAKARELARGQFEAVAKGRDPAAEKRAAKGTGQAIALPTTVGGLCDRYVELHLKPNVRRWENAKGEIDNHIRPRLGNLALTALTRAHVREMARDIGEAHPVAANRALTRLRAVLNWAVAEDLVEANVAAGIKRPTRESPVDRILSDTELRAVWKATDTLNYPGREFARLLILSGQRRDDVRLMRWDELDLESRAWTIPASRFKSRRSHLVPLPDAMVEIIEGLPSNDEDGFVLSLDGGGRAYGNVQRPKGALDKAAKVTGWTWHDLRRTMRTGLSRLGIRRDVAELVIGHSVGGRLGQTYDLYEFADEKRHALDAWARHVQGLAAENVVSIHG
ncbi:MAG: integrase arm-type DNA-binding domain-containing protein [Chloroflexi bacterium]|nr:integrase arm-type DNA-binding domain-containing protein [Chloroflexota bacterium]